jgi:RHS repeat-associated protein
MRSCRWLFPCLVIAALFFVSNMSAQVSTGTPAFGTFGGGPFDVINLGSLNVHFAIPVVHKAGRGLPFNYDLTYDSSVWTLAGVSGSQTWQPAFNWGWQSSYAANSGYFTYSISNPHCPEGGGSFIVIANFAYHDQWGITHLFPHSYITASACSTAQNPFPDAATDGSGLTLAAINYVKHTASIVTRGGALLSPATNPPNGSTAASTTVTDANGNQITSNTSGVFTDTLGQSAVTIAGAPPSATTFTYTGPSGAVAYSMHYASHNVKTNFGCSGIGEYSASSVSLVSDVTLPDGSKYLFTYEPTPSNSGYVTGRLQSITLPTGGSINYTYTGANHGIICADGSTAGFSRQMTPGGTWTYSRSGSGNSWTTTVTDPSSPANESVITFAKDSSSANPTHNFYETQRKDYQGSSSGTLLLTGLVCYNGNYAACGTASVSSPITQRDTYRILPGGKTALVETTYNAVGLIAESKEYDYGVTTGSAPSSTYLLRDTVRTYASLANNIVDRPATVIVKNGTGVTQASSTYSYDETAVSATTGTPNHIAVSGSRGNLTTLTTKSQGLFSLSRTYTYYDTGMGNTATDVNGAQTTFVYGSGSCGNSFPTSELLPLSLSVLMTWDCSAGLMKSSTDENGNPITTTYSDPHYWNHPTSVTDQAQNTTNLTHPSVLESESVLLFNGNQSAVDIVTALDPMGRPQLAQRRQAPGSSTFDTIETDYDSQGRVVKTSLPFAGVEGQTNATAPGVSTTYDAIGRVLTAVDSGTGTVSKVYTQNDTLRAVTPVPSGETAKRKQLEFDGIDRLTSVCELSSGSGSGQCAQTTVQTGYWTKYTYNALGKITGVTQNAQGSGAQSRSFAFDMLGRLTSEINPESGTTTYVYDSDASCSVTSKGDLVKVTDAVANVSCHAYDALHRTTSITYSGPYAGNTPNKYFVYDSATVNGLLMKGAAGRLAEAYTATCASCTKITDVGLSYTKTGKISDLYESTTHSNGYYHLQAAYWANGNLETLSGLPGVPTLTFGPDGEGRTASVTASSGQNPVSSTVYSPGDKPTSVTFGSGDSDGFLYDPNTGRLSQYTFNVNGQALVGKLSWNANQSLGGLSITDPFNSANAQSCSYGFDDLRRISSTNCGSKWSQTFSYDAFGNVSKSGSISFQPTYSPTTNRMTALPGFTPTYDANGNLLTDSAHSYTWDAEGHVASVDSVGLTYDALGRMVEQNRSGSYTQIVYAPNGGKFALMNGQALSKAFVPLPSGAKAVYTSSGLSYYRHSDWLGSSRLATTPSRTVYADVGYAPFGEPYGASGASDLSFTGQNQDTVTGIYDFPSREYSPTQGRWLSPDPSGVRSVKAANPRSWNRYAYALDDPLNLIDPNGECSQPAGLQPGQVGVCIDLFIAAPTISTDVILFDASGLGDNRGPVGDDPSATFRAEYSIVFDPSSQMTTVSVTTGVSSAFFQGHGYPGSTTGDVNATANGDGSVTVSIDTSSLNGFDTAGAPLPGLGAILLDTSLTISPDGTVTVDGGDRSGFPSIEIWSYQSGQDPYNVLYVPETTPADLGWSTQLLPDTSEGPSTTVLPGGDPGSADGSGSDGGGGGSDGSGSGGFCFDDPCPEDPNNQSFLIEPGPPSFGLRAPHTDRPVISSPLSGADL